MISILDNDIFNYVLSQKELSIHFQPIVSVRNRKIVGVEALTRSFYMNEYISPEALFSFSKHHEKGQTLDNICRQNTFETAKSICNNCLLFVNFEASYLKSYIEHSEDIIMNIDKSSIPKKHIVIEINEKGTNSSTDLENFIKIFRENGFLIALDDVGAGHSNLNRIAIAKPDIVKIDRQSITDINKDYYKQEIARAIVNLSKSIGAVTVAEGVETIDEAVSCMNLNIDYFQGYYFSKAQEVDKIHSLVIDNQLNTITESYTKQAKAELKNKKLHYNIYKKNLKALTTSLKKAKMENFEKVLRNYVIQCCDIECIYILDINGYQITSTILNRDIKPNDNPLFSPCKKNDCHNLKSYFYSAVILETEFFTSHKYISIATGRLCQTNSVLFPHPNGNKYVACIDYYVSSIEKTDD